MGAAATAPILLFVPRANRSVSCKADEAQRPGGPPTNESCRLWPLPFIQELFP